MEPNNSPSLVFLFGAGASSGSGAVFPHVPPLGADLVNKMAGDGRFPWWGDMATRIRPELVESQGIEAGLEDAILGWQPGVVRRSVRELALYFSAFTVPAAGTNYYREVIRSLGERNMLSSTLFATINYDCLIELAAASLSIPYSYPQLHEQEGGLAILKLHGSCNWLLESPDDSMSNDAHIGLGDEDLSILPIDNVASLLPKRLRQLDTCGLPAMFPYRKFKNWLAAGPALHQLWSQWEAALKTAKRIIIVGCGVWSHDTLLWKPLREGGADVSFVDLNREAFARLRDLAPSARHIEGTFEQGFPAISELLEDVSASAP